MDMVRSFAGRLDKGVATLVVSSDDETRRFIGEMLLLGAAGYLLKRYADNYLKGLGFDDMAQAHGKRTRAFMDRLRGGTADRQAVESVESDLEEALAQARQKPIDETAKASAKADVVEALMEAGAVRRQAAETANLVEQEIVSAMSRHGHA